MGDGTLDWTTVAWIAGGLFVAFWILRRLFRGLRRILLILVVIGGAVWLTGTGDALVQALSDGLGLGSP
jgi:hypothetical protein